MNRTLLLAGSLLISCACAAHRVDADARRAWVDVTLDDPVEHQRVLAFLDVDDPITLTTRRGERELRPPTVDDALAWLDDHRRQSRHWINDVIQANDRFEATDLPAATVDELSRQLVSLVLEMGPPAEDFPGWPRGANPYAWPAEDGELRASFFGLYLQTGRLCPHASQPVEGCLVQHDGAAVPLAWLLAAQLLEDNPRLAERVTRPQEREALGGLH